MHKDLSRSMTGPSRWSLRLSGSEHHGERWALSSLRDTPHASIASREEERDGRACVR